MIASLLLVPALLVADSLVLEGGARSPAVSPTGRTVVEMRGDLWLLPASGGGSAVPITRGAAWDREPAWTTDGSAVVFASDRGGDPGIWRVLVGDGGAAGEPERVVDTPEPEDSPSSLPDGSVVFVRGRGPMSDLWLRAPDGAERRLTSRLGAEMSPTASPDGRRIAYVSRRDGRLQLRVLTLADSGDVAVAPDYAAEQPAWSPDGARIAFTTRGSPAGTWVAARDGAYVNLVSQLRADPAWTADGAGLLLAEMPPQGPGYNGDPERDGDREWGDVLPPEGGLWSVPVSGAPDAGRAALPVRATVDRASYNAEAFDRVWRRLESRYGRTPGADAARLHTVRETFRPLALAAETERELESVLDRLSRERPPLLEEVSGGAAVSSAHPLATAAGLEILRKGGNVVDAAVAVSFALGVVEPDASGIGGYGSMVLHLEGMAEPTAIEFLTRVPQAATLENGHLLRDGRIPADGPVLANVPGTVAGMELAWKRYGSGKVKWAELLEPAIRVAEQGFVLDESFTTTLRTEREGYARYPSAQALFFPGGEPLQVGDTLRNPDLAWTLREIARDGAKAFYEGEIARRMVEDLRGKGNAMQLHDLSRYYAVEREPVRSTYRDNTVYSSPPATTGGVSLAARLNLLERFAEPRLYADHAPTLHAMVEAWKLTPSTSGRVADPSLWPVDLDPFVNKDTAAARWRCFDPARSLDPPDEGEPLCEAGEKQTAEWGAEGILDCPDGVPASDGRGCRMTGTTAFAIADAAGNMISVTQTLGTWGGNFYVTPGLGFLYNDKLGSYADEPEAYNARVPFARNSTSISPTLVFDGVGAAARPLAAIGAAGNAWITSAVYQMLVGIVDRGLGPQQALELPRFLPSTQRLPGGEREVVIQLEDAFAPGVLRELEALGHRVQRISRKGELRMGYGAAVVVGEGGVRAGADPRRSGAAGAVQQQ